MNPRSVRVRALATLFVCAGLAACAGGGGPVSTGANEKPKGIGTVSVKAYATEADDLLTAGLGRTGLAGASPPVANPVAPTAAELRRLAIWNNYRSLVDVNARGGYGTLYGPNVDAGGNDYLSEG